MNSACQHFCLLLIFSLINLVNGEIIRNRCPGLRRSLLDSDLIMSIKCRGERRYPQWRWPPQIKAECGCIFIYLAAKIKAECAFISIYLAAKINGD